MPGLVILCPTRGRPAAAREAYRSFCATNARRDSQMLFVIDSDDPQLDAYLAESYPVLKQDAPGNMVQALNRAALWVLGEMSPAYLGFIGDDHRFRTKGWDEAFVSVLDERHGGFVYGNDLFWPNGEIPTQIVVSAPIVQTLGWMGLPGCRHLYIDNAWRTLGEATKSIVYMPDVVIEHMHPAGGKAAWDAGHLRVNTPEMFDHDRQAYERWLGTSAEQDIVRVAAALDRG